MDKIEAKAKVILPSNTNNKSLINVGSAIDKTNSNTNSLNNDKTTPNRNGEIIVLHRFSEERVISLTILSILSLILISITISFIYIYIFKKYFRQILSLLIDFKIGGLLPLWYILILLWYIERVCKKHFYDHVLAVMFYAKVCLF